MTDPANLIAELPVRFINPDQNLNTIGVGDARFGFKLGFVACEHRSVTFQLRAYIPTGDADKGLGTDHLSIEPAFLLRQRFNCGLTIEAEVKDWIPLDGSSLAPVDPGQDFFGNVMRYGIGVGYDIVDDGSFRVTPVTEIVGWTLLDGFGFDGNALSLEDVTGDTIVNGKLGVRATFRNADSIYAGYGLALTGERWYDDVVRIEYRGVF